jgi:hypothetical protein
VALVPMRCRCGEGDALGERRRDALPARSSHLQGMTAAEVLSRARDEV